MCPLGAIALAKAAVPYASLFVIQLLKDIPESPEFLDFKAQSG